MRFSQMFVPTLKEIPKDAVLASHQLLLRAGYIQQVGSGIYNFLPLGKKMLDSIRALIKEEMDRIGAQEILMGFITPAELWQESGRYNQYGKELLRLKDRKDNEFVLGPTHEEMVTHIARSFIRSYKQLPLHLYQIHTKFRDEARPRFGLMRAREFVMKDGYSFHSSYEDLDKEFVRVEQAYRRICERLGLEYKIVEADSGAIGGSGSKEFMVLAHCGEDTLAVCKNCDYGANLEAAKRKDRQTPKDEGKYGIQAPKAAFAEFLTPEVTTIESLCEFFKIHPFFTIKAVVKKAVRQSQAADSRGDSLSTNDSKFAEQIKTLENGLSEANPITRSGVSGDSLSTNDSKFAEQICNELIVFFVRGDDECEETKALNALNALGEHHYLALEDAPSELLESAGLKAGFIGPIGLEGVRYILDEGLRDAKDMITGANKKDYHIVGIDVSEFEELKNAHYADIIKVREGDLCPHCAEELQYAKGIEIGHIFKLGEKYSHQMDAKFLDHTGKAQNLIMGCYGIGVTRLLPAILEQKSDEFGCVWGENVRIFDVVIIVSNIKDSEQMAYATKTYEALLARGVDVVLDDRDERFGFKMKDFELIGFYQALIVGKTLSEGKVELIKREGLQKRIIDASDALDSVIKSTITNDNTESTNTHNLRSVNAK